MNDIKIFFSEKKLTVKQLIIENGRIKENCPSLIEYIIVPDVFHFNSIIVKEIKEKLKSPIPEQITWALIFG